MASEELTDRLTLRRMLRDADVRPSKRLGQNFLADPGVLGAIRDAVSAESPSRIVEIGAGFGAVTSVLASLAPDVVAVEIDQRLVEALERNVASCDSVAVRHCDVLDYEIERASDGGKVVVVGCIPYAITAPILQRIVAQREAVSAAVLVTQREVAEKIAVSPGASGSALGVLVRGYADVRLLRRVGRGSFFPVPEVDSTLWTMHFLEGARFTAGSETFFTMVRAIYGVRRKMLRVALRAYAERECVDDALKAAGIEGTVRGETLGFDELDRLARAFERGEASAATSNVG